MVGKMQISRAQRRAYERYLKKTDPAKYKEYKAGSAERGRQLQQAALENVRAAQSDFFERKQEDIVRSLRAAGKTNEEIDAYLEKWLNDVKVH